MHTPWHNLVNMRSLFRNWPRTGLRYARPAGFTAVEMLVVTALLLVVTVSVTDIFSSVSRTNRRIYANQQVQSNVRAALETIVREVHQDTVDYDCYASAMCSQDVLALKTSTGTPVRFQQNGTRVEMQRGTSPWTPLTTEAVAVSAFTFYLRPETDPFAPCEDVACSTVPNEQPRLTLALSAQVITGHSGDQPAAVFVQTTVLTRSYQR